MAARGYNRKGRSLFIEQKYDEAAIEYEKAIKLMPDFAEFYINLGDALKELNKNDEAILNYKKGIELEPMNGNYNLKLGEFFLNKKNMMKLFLFSKKQSKTKLNYLIIINFYEIFSTN